MQNKWLIVILSIVVGFTGGMLVGKHKAGNAEDAHMAMEEGGHHMHHEMVEVPAGAAAPTVDVIVHKDPKGGYNVELKTTNFTFAPHNASTEHVFGEGHAHIYVDGTKINRVYGTWYHLADIGGVGEHEIRVELSANNHSAYALNGERIEDIETVVVEAPVAFDAAAAKEIELTIAERTLAPKTVEVTEGESVRLVVATDEAGEFHIAGYEIVKDMDVEGTVVVEFVADKPGRYNLEMHPAMAMDHDGHGDDHMGHDDHAMHEDIEIGALVVNPR